MTIELTPLPEVKAMYETTLEQYKTVSAKRARMTRDINAFSGFIMDIRESIGKYNGWFLGDKYNQRHLAHYERELQLMKDIRECVV